MAIVVKAPNNIEIKDISNPRIFLAGSIDMGKAENWQARLERELSEYNVVLMNPRRDDWDATWEQSIQNPKFNEQVNWELDNIEYSDLVVVYFDPAGQAPITLMELGYALGCNLNVIVCCPDGYWRKGNVEILCDRNGIELYNNIDDFIFNIRTMIEDKFQ